MIFNDHQDDLCTFVKTAGDESLLNSQVIKDSAWVEKPELHDRDFALILVDREGKEHRKYAMFDAGNTILSTYYFLNNTPNIGEGATKLAAANLAQALYYQVENSQSSPEFQELTKLAEGIDTVEGLVDERRALYSPTVEQESEKVAEEVNPFNLIKEASQHWASVPLFEKRSAAIRLCSIADTVGATVPEKIAQYAGDFLSPNFEMLMSHRTQKTANEELQNGYRRLSKLAYGMEPSEVVEALFLLDEQAGLLNKYASALPDPVLCVFSTGHKKEASWSWTRGSDSVNERQLKSYASSVASFSILEKLFGEAFRDSFRKDPILLFEKLPEEQQTIVARLASQSRFSNDGGN